MSEEAKQGQEEEVRPQGGQDQASEAGQPQQEVGEAAGQGEQPQPAQAQGGPLRTVVAIVLIVIIAIALASIGRNLAKSRKKTTSSSGQPAACGIMEGQIPNPCGSVSARVKLVIVMSKRAVPLMMQMSSVFTHWPEKIHAEFYAVESPEGQQFLKDHGVEQKVGCVFINGKTEFTIKDAAGKEKKVVLQGPLGSSWTGEDLAAVLADQLKQAYGQLPQGFDAQVETLAQMKIADECVCPAESEESGKAEGEKSAAPAGQ